MNKEELIERRTHVRMLVADVNNARSRDLRNEKMRHNAKLRDEYNLHALNVDKIEEEYRAQMINLKAERDMLSHEVPDDVQEGCAE